MQRNNPSLILRPACQNDFSQIWEILKPILRAGEFYALPPEMTQESAIAYWTKSDHDTFVVEEDGKILGTYFLRANQLGAALMSQIAAMRPV